MASAADGLELALALLARDTGARRVPEAQRARRVRRAVAMGRAAAARLAAAHGTREPRALAARLGVAVETRDAAPAVPWLRIESEYYGAPPRIVLYAGTLAEGEARLQDVGYALPAGVWADLHVAHELFHYLEDRQGMTVSRRLAYTRRRLGPWRWRVRLGALREVAAHAFAQALLDLPWSPLDLARLSTPSAPPSA
jgi:hypothetical protein